MRTAFTTLAIIDRLNEYHDWTDYRCAKMLEINHQAISAYRKKGTIMSDQTAAKAAKLLGLPPELFVSGVRLERSLNTPLEETERHLFGIVEHQYQDEIEAANQGAA